MKRPLSVILILAMIVSLFAGLAITASAASLSLTFSLTSNPGSWPTATSTTLTDYTYTLDGVYYTFALKNVKQISGYLMLTQPAALGLPAISGKTLTKVVAHNSSGCSTSVNVGVSSSDSSASYISGGDAQKWATQGSSYTYNLSGTSANTMYYLYVTSKNAQITSLELTYEDEGAPACTHENTTLTGAVAASCTTDGYTGDYICDDCGAIATAGEVIPATGHVDANSDDVCDVCGAVSYTVADSVFVGDRIVLVAAYDDKYYAMKNDNTTISNALAATEVTVSGNEVLFGEADVVWTVEAGSSEGSYLLKSSDDKYVSWISGTTTKLAETGADFTVTGGAGTSSVLLTNTAGTEDVRGLIFRDNVGALQFRAYNTENATQSGYSDVLTIYAVSHEHVPTAADAVAATCTTAGHSAGSVCSVCGKVLPGTEEIPALGHDWVAGTPVAVTCTEDGYTPYTCSRCSETKVDDVVEATGHVYADGICSVCGDIITAGWYLVDDYSDLSNGIYAIISTNYYAFNGTITSGHGQHTEAAFSFDENGYATAAPEGTLQLTFASTANGFTLYNETLGYFYATKASSGGLAWRDSEDSGWSFSADGGLYTANNAHLRSYNDTFRTYAGNSNNPVYLAKLLHAHAAEAVAAVPATCTEPGATAGTVCSICGEILSGCEEIAALGHDWSAGTPVAATCTEDGYTPYSCSRCEESKQEDIVPALGHDWIAGTPVVADGVTDGYTPYTCSRCDATKQDDIVHNYVCGVCTVCGAQTFAVANSVSVGDRIVLVAAYNSKYYAMANDNATVYNSLVATEVTVSGSEVAFGDADVVWKVVAGSAEGSYRLQDKDGKYISWTSGTALSLSNTGADFTVTCGEGTSSILPVGDSTRGLVFRDSATSGPYFRAYPYSTATQDKYSTVLTIYTIPAGAHTAEAVAAVPATCTAAGSTAGTVCSVCGKVLSGCEEIAALGHDLGAPTDNNNGTHTQTCNRCSEVITSDCSLTATEPGGNEFECSVCGHTVNLTQFTKTTTVANGSLIVIYHPTSGKALSATASGTKLAAVTVPPDYYSGSKLCLPEGAAIMTVVDYNSATGEFHLAIDDNGVTKYLTSGATGSSLSFAALADPDYALWEIDTTTGLVLKNVNAAYNGKGQSLEYYNNFITYSHNTTAAFQMELFTGNANCTHENTTLAGFVPATCTTDGYTGDEVCDDCGATVSYGSVLPATGHTYVDGVCTVCGAEEPAGLTGNYYIAAKRSTGNYQWMTNDLGTASTKRYQAEDSGLTVLPAEIASDVDNAKLWRLELQQDGTYLLSSNGSYSTWSSGNSANLGETGAAITITANGDAVQMTISDGARYLSLNSSATNNYFAYYTGSQINDLYLVPVTACLNHIPTCVDNGDGTHDEVCSVCGAVLTAGLAHTFDVGVCTFCGAVDTSAIELKIDTASLTLYEDIVVNFTASVPEGLTDPYMVIEMNGQSYTLQASREDDQGRLVFEFLNLTPDMMGDNIKATLYATTEGGQLVHFCKPEYSIKQYCTNVMAAYPDDQKLQTLLADMLVYGAATQRFTGHNADSLVTAGLDLSAASTFTNLTDTDQSTSETTDANIHWTGAGLECGSRMSMYFTLTTAAGDATSVEVTINGRTTVYEYADMMTDDPTVCRVVFRGISASEYGDVVTAVLKNNGTPVQTLTYSVNSYVYSKQNDTAVENLAQLVKAIYNYGKSAKDYLN